MAATAPVRLLTRQGTNLVESDVEPPSDALVEPRMVVHELGGVRGRAIPVDIVSDPAFKIGLSSLRLSYMPKYSNNLIL